MISRRLVFGVLSFVGALLLQAPVLAATGDTCLCTDDLTKINPANYATITSDQLGRTQCITTPTCDTESVKKTGGLIYDRCARYNNSQLCAEARDTWDRDFLAQMRDAQKAESGTQVRTGLSAFIPSCAFEKELTAECKDVGIFIILLINICRYLFSIIGGVALLVFIYGGFILILSQGHSEQVEKGKGAMTSAVIGLVVAFSGYLLIRFLSDLVGVDVDFRL